MQVYSRVSEAYKIFLSLERSTIIFIILGLLCIIEKEILDLQADYYANFYAETLNNSHDDRKLMTYLNTIQILQISGQTKEHRNMIINVQEINMRFPWISI